MHLECKCCQCGKTPPIIKSKSNSNWVVYDTKNKCECGGSFIPVIEGDFPENKES